MVGEEGGERPGGCGGERYGTESWVCVCVCSRNGNSSASSLGVADLEGFPECSISAGLISEERERKAAQSPEQADGEYNLNTLSTTEHCVQNTTQRGGGEGERERDEVTSGLSTAGSSCQRELLVVNFDLGVDSVDVELRAALQWIAASELGVPALYFRKTQEHSLAKFQRVVHLAGQKAWRVGDLFGLIARFCQLQQDEQEAGGSAPGLFDWLLKTQR
ncbi:hypothetical protein NFI96_006337 [Prochilodus magdalenae]|nr:hypothetical protein NFI96_006337 [Prochilodus magdalenae]